VTEGHGQPQPLRLASRRREREQKLEVGPDFHLSTIDLQPDGLRRGEASEARLEATYWDTPDLRLIRWGVSLRHRTPEGWTLKLPGAPGARMDRDEVTAAGTPRVVPATLSGAVRAYVRGEPLKPIAHLSTWRRRLPLYDVSEQFVAEIVDDEVAVLQRRRVVARFRELEVELSENGNDHILDGIIERLVAGGARPAEQVPKLVRALGEEARRAADVATGPLPRKPAVHDVVRRALGESVTALFRYDPGIRLGGDPEDVHRGRVATRRLRSHLRTFRPLLVRDWADRLRVDLGWVADALGEVRDREVLWERLQGHADRVPHADRALLETLHQRLLAETDDARRRLAEAMDSPRYLSLLERLIDAVAEPAVLPQRASRPAAPALLPLAQRAWRELRTGVVALPPDPPDAELHRCRILAKRARYAAEVMVPVAGRDATRFVRAATVLQQVLGELQDSVSAQEWLRAGAGTGRRAWLAGELAGLELAGAESARRLWPAAWGRLDRKKLRAWMKG
jgi:CHAD domain-containing protein